MGALVTQSKKDTYKEKHQQMLIDNVTKFWECMNELKPKDFVDEYIKLHTLVFPKPPTEVPLTPDGQLALQLKKTEQTATLIAGGIPTPVEDTNYEEEDQ